MSDSAGQSDCDDPQGRSRLRLLTEHSAEVVWRVPGLGWCGTPEPRPGALLSGSFNPRHAGHVELRRAAERHLEVAAAYELPLMNADKPAVDIAAALLRCRQFDDGPLAVTRAATFLEKARLFPETVFVVGIDTAIRILDERFYAGCGGRGAAFSRIADARCRFLVAPRLVESRFLRLCDLAVPAAMAALFEELPESEFRSDLSSTSLRNA